MASSGGRRAGSDRFLPPDPRVEGPYRFTPQLALRIGILVGVSLLVFGVLFFRLWALQVLSGPQYLQAALDNQLRSVRIEAPRGMILDRKGRELVRNVPGTAVQLWPADLPNTWAARLDELKRLSRVVHVPVPQLLREIKRRGNDPITPITVRESVNRTAPINYLLENSEEFPGVHVTDTFIRSYPYGSRAAHVLGYVNEISAEQLKRLQSKGYAAGDKIGEAGVESSYDAYLRGRAGLAQLRVDSLGKPRSELVLKRQYAQGESIKLTLDIELQRAAEQALVYGIQKARNNGQWAANGGAIVALDPHDGSILALASNPTYDPKLYTGRVSTRKLRNAGLDPATAEVHNFPSLDRAISGLYPAGSTFKPVTALAALETHVISPSTALSCTPDYTVYKEDGSHQVAQVFKNWDPFSSSTMTLPTAIAVSCDTFFYQLGYDFYKLPPSAGHPLQAWAAKFGIGRRTGVDIGPESGGLLPTPEWRNRTFTAKTDPNWRDRPPLEARRLDPADDRPEGPAGDAAPDGSSLRADRQRREPRAAAHRPVGRRRRRQLALARAHDSFVHGARAAAGRPRPDLPRGRQGRARAGDAGLLRHLERRVPELPDRDRRQDGNRREGDSEPSVRPVRPVMVVRLRARRHG